MLHNIIHIRFKEGYVSPVKKLRSAREAPLKVQMKLLSTSLLMIRNITQTYKHTPPPPCPPKREGEDCPSPLSGGGGGVGGGEGAYVYTSV